MRNKYRFSCYKLAYLYVFLLMISFLSGCANTAIKTPDEYNTPPIDQQITNGDTLDDGVYKPSSLNYIAPINDYTPPKNEDGYIVITMPASIISIAGITAKDLAEDFFSSTPPDNRITDIIPNEDGSADYYFTSEQFDIFKKDTYDTGCYEYGIGTFPQSIKTVEYTEIDEDGIPWAAVVSIDYEIYKETELSELLGFTYGMAWPANYLAQYQIFCGIPTDAWSVHMTMKNVESGEVLAEYDFQP